MTEQRRSRFRATGTVAGLAATALILTACSSGTSDTGTEDGAIEFSMTYQAANNAESPYEVLAKTYMEANPNVTITLNPQPNDTYGQNLRTQLNAGNAPDIVQTAPGRGQPNSVVALAEAGFLSELDETAAGIVPAGSESLFGLDGATYGQPMELTVTSMVYSTTNADKAGISAFPSDFDAYLQACADVASQGRSMLAVAGAAPPNTGMLAMSLSASRVYAETPDWNDQRTAGDVSFADSEGWKTTLETIVSLNDAGCFQGGVEGGGFDVITNGLGQGTALGAIVPSATAAEIQRSVPDSVFVVEPWPVDSGASQYVLASSNYALSINAASDKGAAAKAFLDWVAEPAQAQAFADASGALPVTGYEQLDLSSTIYAPVADILAAGDFAPLPNNMWPNAQVYEELGTGVQGLFTGQKTVDQVLAAMDTAWG